MTLLAQSELDALARLELPGKATGAQTGHVHQKARIDLLARRCCEQGAGDLCEIGCYTGDTSMVLAKVARDYGRKLVCIDDFRPGTEYRLDTEIMPIFLENTAAFSDVVIFSRVDAHSTVGIRVIQQHRYCCAFSDDGHDYDDHFSEMMTLLPVTDGLIIADDSYLPWVAKAIDDTVARYPGWSVLKNERLAESYVLKGIE